MQLRRESCQKFNCPACWPDVSVRRKLVQDKPESTRYLCCVQGVFLTTVSFAEEGMAFTPDRNAVLDVLNSNSIEGSITLTQAAPRLLFMRGFSHFFEGKPSGLNPVNIIK